MAKSSGLRPADVPVPPAVGVAGLSSEEPESTVARTWTTTVPREGPHYNRGTALGTSLNAPAPAAPDRAGGFATPGA
jgi:hypothetical protein